VASDVTTTDAGKPVVDVNSVKHTLYVAILLCLGCSVLVSLFAVGLKSTQDENRKAFQQKNVLQAAGLWTDGMNSQAEFESRVEQLVLNFETDTIEEDADPEKIDTKKDSKKPELSDQVTDDIANVKRREKRTVIYRITDDGKETLVLPVRGYGLWSTLWGFIALDMTNAEAGADQITVKGLTYYDQKETPGLGGEVDNPLWKAKWVGKKAFAKDWTVKVKVTKGAEGIYQVDALSGATITSRGVSNMLAYWLGDEGFGPYLKRTSGAAPAEPQADGEDNAEVGHAGEKHADETSGEHK
jgi:Na+-transporting NADH:ubiquinone oxidoreductase subunit C